MFDWAKWSSLQTMIRAGVPGANHDGWLEGWMVGMAQQRWTLRRRLAVLDVELGDGPRPYLDAYRSQGAAVTRIPAADLPEQSGQYGLITALCFERERCLAPLDFARPFARLEPLLAAAGLLQPGGALLWSYLYCYPPNPETIHEALEPAAAFQTLVRRGLRPLAPWPQPAERLAIYHDPDTLYVSQQAVLEHSPRQQRIIRVFGGLWRPGAPPCVRARHDVDLYGIGTRTLGRALVQRLGRKLRRLVPGGPSDV